jgi:hypothetical protein
MYLVVAVEALKKKERQDETQFLSPKLVEKLVWVPVVSLCVKFSFPIMPKLAVLAP